MKRAGRTAVLFVAAATIFVGAACWHLAAWHADVQAEQSYRTLSREAGNVAVAAAELRRLSAGTRRAVDPSPESRNPAAFFERLAAENTIDAACIKAVVTAALPRSRNSPYEELATEVRLVGVEQAQLGRFLQDIEKENPQYLVKQLRMTASDRGVAAWDANVTVSLLVYRPESPEEP